MVETLIEAGLRWGELVALKPRHIDFLRRSLMVEETIVEVSKTHSPTGREPGGMRSGGSRLSSCHQAAASVLAVLALVVVGGSAPGEWYYAPGRPHALWRRRRGNCGDTGRWTRTCRELQYAGSPLSRNPRIFRPSATCCSGR
jgi:integrase